MTLNEFEILDDCAKIDLLYKAGVYSGKCRSGKSIVILYQLEGFYVEIFYKKYRCIISRLHCFTSTKFLNPYLQQIDVEHLVKC